MNQGIYNLHYVKPPLFRMYFSKLDDHSVAVDISLVYRHAATWRGELFLDMATPVTVPTQTGAPWWGQ